MASTSRWLVGFVAVTITAYAMTVLPATAHPASEFEACTVHIPGMCIDRGATFEYGDRVRVKGSVQPEHAGFDARVLRQAPHSNSWERVGAVTVSSDGNMRFTWRTRQSDAVQDAPYLLRFRIAGHGHSNATEAWVIFGE